MMRCHNDRNYQHRFNLHIKIAECGFDKTALGYIVKYKILLLLNFELMSTHIALITVYFF